jgi:hypothetical protein
MISEAMLAYLIVCTEPKMPFRKFFEQTKGYNIQRAPNYMPHASYVLDLGDALADYQDYVGAYTDRCEEGK